MSGIDRGPRSNLARGDLPAGSRGADLARRDDEYALIADLYDLVAPYRSRTDVDFFVEEALGAGGPVLEVGCGTGRVSIPTARAGVDVVGVDLSPRMLQVCRERLADEPEIPES